MPAQQEQITPAAAPERPGYLRYRRPLLAGLLLAPVVAALAVTGFFYVRFAREIDQRLRDGPFHGSSNIYAAPLVISVNDPIDAAQFESELSMSGYRQNGAGPGTWSASGDVLRVAPVDGSESQPVSAVIANGAVKSLQRGGRNLQSFDFGRPLLATLSANREKRRLVTFSEIPPVLVHAIVSAEDKHFFQHAGLDLPRVAKAAWIDFRDGRKAQGASTLTMQLVRGLWLEPDKRWKRKLAEALMTIHLEHKWTKQRIFETYVNEVFLGRQAAYDIQGFGEASRVFFGKPLSEISLPEAALLAGMVQRPTYFNPVRNPEHARERRNLVLSLMRENGYIDESQLQDAIVAPVAVRPPSAPDGVGAPYFLDLVTDELQNDQAQDSKLPASVDTTIDVNLQRAADEAVADGMKQVDRLLARKEKDGARPQAALIAIDPHTGEIRALVGGRNYARSQLNRVLARRPPGSVFKPFVYAAALNTAITGADQVLTPASTVDDGATTFWFNGQAYEPSNFKHEEFGTLTLRDALAKSDNVDAVKVAQMVGYANVVRMARQCGLNGNILATPAVALGTYDVTPLEMAGAYTVFANGGIHVQPVLVSGSSSIAPHQAPYQAIDPRVAWLMDSMLEEVMRSGTAAGVRGRGFTLPAAGKTGTSHDGWFAGFTSRLLCVVWVGFDDYRDLGLEGAKSALPIWTEFMKRASQFGEYRKAREFPMPGGIESARICMDSGQLAGDFCDRVRTEYFIDGTEPQTKCEMHSAPAPQQTASDATTGADVSGAVASAAGNSAPQ